MNAEKLLRQYEFLFEGYSVSNLSGNEFAPNPNISLKQQINDFFNSLGNRANSVFGEVVLDNRAFKDTSYHGIGREKVIAFKAVPDVLEKGIEILPMSNHKQGVVSGMIGAPVKIGDKDYIMVVVVRKYGGGNRLYLHEVTLKEKLPVDLSKPHKGGNPKGDILSVLNDIANAKPS